MDDQRDLGPRIREVYVRLRGDRGRAGQDKRAPQAILDGYLRGLDQEQREGAEPPSAASGAFSPAAAKRALQVVARPYGAGALVVTDGARDLALVFAPSGLKAALLGGRFPSLARRLADTQRLDAAGLQRLEQARERFKSEAEALVSACGVAPEVAAEGAGELVGQALLDALLWDSPCFEAVAVEDAGASLLQRRDVDVLTVPSRGLLKTLLAGLQERLDQLAPACRSVPSAGAPLEAKGGGGGRSGSLTPRQSDLLAAVAARPGVTLAELAADEALGRRPLHTVAADLHELAARSLLVVGDAPKAAEAAAPAEDGLSPLARRLRQAKAAVDTGDRRRACRALARVGGTLLEQKRAPEAARCFAAARALAPQDLEGHDGLVRALGECGRREEALVESEELVRHYLDSHLPARARRTAQRALAGRDDPATQLLLVEAAAALGELRAAAELGERVVARLGQDGRRAEAQALAEALLAAGGGAASQRKELARGAAGVASPLVVRGLAAAIVALAVGLALAQRDLVAREAYAAAVRGAEEALARDPLDVAAARTRLERPLSGRAAQAQRRALDQLDLLLADRATWDALAAAVRAPDLDARLAGIDALRAKTPALEEALGLAHQAVVARRKEVEEQLGAFQGLVARGDLAAALVAAQRAVRTCADAPRVLAAASLPIRVTSSPPRAVLRWDGAAITQNMPFDVQLPLTGVRTIEVSLPGHRSVRRRLSVLTIDDPTVQVVLRPLAPGEADVPVDDTRPPAPSPDGEGCVAVRDGVLRGGAAALTFPPAPSALLADVRLPTGERGRVDLVHEVGADGAVTLVLVRVTLERRGPDGWRAAQPVSFAPGAPVARAVRGGAVGPLSLDAAWLREKVERALAHARGRAEAAPRE